MTISYPTSGATVTTVDEPSFYASPDPATNAWERGARAVSREALLSAARGKLSRLLQLPVGWDGHRGRPTSPIAAMVVNALLEVLVKDDGPTPQVQPMPNGGAATRWLVAGASLEVEVEPTGEVLIAADHADGTEEFSSEFSYRAANAYALEQAEVWLDKLAGSIERHAL